MQLPQYVLANFSLALLFLPFFALFLHYAPKIKVDEGKKNRLVFLDFIKGLAILGVISIHAFATAPQNKIFDLFIWFPVPVFILCSGYLLGRRYQTQVDCKKFFKNAFFRVFLIYSLFVLAINLMQGFSITGFLASLLLGLGNLYFIPLLMQFYILFPFIAKIKNKPWFPAVVALSLLLSIYLMYLTDELQKPFWNSNPWAVVFCGRFLFYFLFGVLLSNFNFSNIRAKHIMLSSAVFFSAMLFIFFAINIRFQVTLYPIFFTAVAYAVYKKTFQNAAIFYKPFQELGKHSLVVYMSHSLVVYSLTDAFSTLFQNTEIKVILLIAVTTAASYVISAVFMQTYLRLTGKYMQ